MSLKYYSHPTDLLQNKIVLSCPNLFSFQLEYYQGIAELSWSASDNGLFWVEDELLPYQEYIIQDFGNIFKSISEWQERDMWAYTRAIELIDTVMYEYEDKEVIAGIVRQAMKYNIELTFVEEAVYGIL
jgi:hypothetical protein